MVALSAFQTEGPAPHRVRLRRGRDVLALQAVGHVDLKIVHIGERHGRDRGKDRGGLGLLLSALNQSGKVQGALVQSGNGRRLFLPKGNGRIIRWVLSCGRGVRLTVSFRQ